MQAVYEVNTASSHTSDCWLGLNRMREEPKGNHCDTCQVNRTHISHNRYGEIIFL